MISIISSVDFLLLLANYKRCIVNDLSWFYYQVKYRCSMCIIMQRQLTCCRLIIASLLVLPNYQNWTFRINLRPIHFIHKTSYANVFAQLIVCIHLSLSKSILKVFLSGQRTALACRLLVFFVKNFTLKIRLSSYMPN